MNRSWIVPLLLMGAVAYYFSRPKLPEPVARPPAAQAPEEPIQAPTFTPPPPMPAPDSASPPPPAIEVPVTPPPAAPPTPNPADAAASASMTRRDLLDNCRSGSNAQSIAESPDVMPDLSSAILARSAACRALAAGSPQGCSSLTSPKDASRNQISPRDGCLAAYHELQFIAAAVRGNTESALTSCAQAMASWNVFEDRGIGELCRSYLDIVRDPRGADCSAFKFYVKGDRKMAGGIEAACQDLLGAFRGTRKCSAFKDPLEVKLCEDRLAIVRAAPRKDLRQCGSSMMCYAVVGQMAQACANVEADAVAVGCQSQVQARWANLVDQERAFRRKHGHPEFREGMPMLNMLPQEQRMKYERHKTGEGAAPPPGPPPGGPPSEP